MLLQQAGKGQNKGPLELMLLNKALFPPDLLKLTLITSDSCKVNLFVEGKPYVNFFNRLHTKTTLTLMSFVIKDDFTIFKKHIPECLSAETIALALSDFKFYLELPKSFGTMLLSFAANSLELSDTTDLNSVDMSGLYSHKESVSLSPERHAGEKFLDLRQIYDKVKTAPISCSCWAVLVDCCDSYHPKDTSQDFLVTYKITDPSIYPDHACINIFHKDPKSIPKIAHFGDIIFFSQLQFKDYKGIIQGVVPASSKLSSYHVFMYNDVNFTPYASYKSNFNRDPEGEKRINSLIPWVSNTLENSLPSFWAKTLKKLTEITQEESEIDVIGRVLDITSTGINPEDPVVVFLGDGDKIFQFIVTHERRRLLRWVKPADTIRIRSVFCEMDVLYLNIYTEVLKLPFKSLQVLPISSSEQLLMLKKHYYCETSVQQVSQVAHKYMKFPLVSFEKINMYPVDSIIRIEGYMVRIKFKTITKVVIWDGFDEKSRIEAVIERDDLEKFLNGILWENVSARICSADKLLHAAVKVCSDHLQIVHTQLIN
jgi:hypothetical protein